MAIDPSFLDEIRQRASLIAVMGRRNKLVRSGRNWKICCPFHGEKTPSLYIYDDHHYHCYGCQAHGDVISYMMHAEGCNFLEAVEKLAAEVGLEVPKTYDPLSEERVKKAKSLTELLSYVEKAYCRKLYEDEGRDALSYLQKRGLKKEILERFGIGWAGSERTLLDVLLGAGFSLEHCKASGLFRLDERGEIKGALFFNRVMFPIRNRKGEVISFGGRILGDGQPKYVNGPETEVFSKKRNLFNLDRATGFVRKGAPLVVVEGYMDVIALDQAGISGAVAPLGTALGEEQLALLWRLSSEPILCLDGDQAGIKASLRTCEIAIPLLSDNKTLRFCRLENGDDPDSLVKREGRLVMEGLLKAARPLVEEVFLLLTAGQERPGPEKRASLRKRLVALADSIKDKTLSSEYRSTLLDLFFQRYRSRPSFNKGAYQPLSQGWRGQERGTRALGEIFARPTLSIIEGHEARLKILCVLLLYYPALFLEVEPAYSQLVLSNDLAQIREAFLEWAYSGTSLDKAACWAWMEEKGLDEICRKLMDSLLPALARRLKGEESLDEILDMWWHFYALVNFPQFEEEVQREIQEEIMRAYERPLAYLSKENALEPSNESQVESSFPKNLKAKMRVLDALRRGEKLEIEEDF